MVEKKSKFLVNWGLFKIIELNIIYSVYLEDLTIAHLNFHILQLHAVYRYTHNI